jgi:hypothetical protein
MLLCRVGPRWCLSTHVLRILAGTKIRNRLVISGTCHEQLQPRDLAMAAETPAHLESHALQNDLDGGGSSYCRYQRFNARLWVRSPQANSLHDQYSPLQQSGILVTCD